MSRLCSKAARGLMRDIDIQIAIASLNDKYLIVEVHGGPYDGDRWGIERGSADFRDGKRLFVKNFQIPNREYIYRISLGELTARFEGVKPETVTTLDD